jgi:hypothetical protein
MSAKLGGGTHTNLEWRRILIYGVVLAAINHGTLILESTILAIMS